MPTNNPWAAGGQYHQDWSKENNPALESPFNLNYAQNAGAEFLQHNNEYSNTGNEHLNAGEEYSNYGAEYENIGTQYANEFGDNIINEFSPTDTNVLDTTELFENDREVLGLKKTFKEKSIYPMLLAGSIDRRGLEDSKWGYKGDPNQIDAVNLSKHEDKILENFMSRLYFFFTFRANEQMKKVAKSMFTEFLSKTNSSNYYINLFLNSEIENHPESLQYLKIVNKRFSDLLNDYCNGNIIKVFQYLQQFGKMDIAGPVFADLLKGFRITTDSINYAETYIDDFTTIGKKYTATVTVKLYDSFGLDTPDIMGVESLSQKYWIPKDKYDIYLDGFKAWWLLQHTRGYKPLEVHIYFTTKFYGTLK